MSNLNSQLKNKIYERWSPKLEKRLAEKGIKINEQKKKNIALMAHTRSVFESQSTVGNTPGRGAYSFGNNPMNPADTSRGSAEVLQKLFGVFVDVAATTSGIDLLTTLPMNKSSIMIVVAEPVYAGGKKDSTTDRLPVFQVKGIKGAGVTDDFVVGNEYTIALTAPAGNIKVKFVGRHLYNGNLIFRLGAVDAALASKTIAECLDSATTSAKITMTGGDYTFDGSTVDYVNGFTNFIGGFTGAGALGTSPYSAHRNNGKSLANPLNREVGETIEVNRYGARMWNRNFAAGTYHATVDFTIEQVQDAKMDHDFDMLEFGDEILQDALAQSINNHILSHIFAAGWQHHVALRELTGRSLNCYISNSTSTSPDYTYVDLTDTQKTITGTAGVIPNAAATMAISENLSTIQRRIVTRMLYTSSIVKNRARNGVADTAVMNGTNSTAIKDVKGYALAPFDHELVTGDTNLSFIGTVNNMNIYEDGLMDLSDGRIAVFKKAQEKRAGLFFCPYILAEKMTTVAEGLMEQKTLLKSRYAIAEAGSHPESSYCTFVVDSDEAHGYDIV